MIRLLALDLDGTTLDSSGNISDENRSAIRAAEEMGVLVTIATGRRFRDARPVGLDLEINAPLITHNGGLIKFVDTLETVHFSLLAASMAETIISLGSDLGGDALVSVDPHGSGTMLYSQVSESNIPLQRYIAWAERLHGDAADASVMHVPDLNEVIAGHEVVHISFSGKCDAMETLRTYLMSELGSSVNVLSTEYPHLDFTLLDILPVDASKGHGVAHIAEMNNIERNDIMVIGDNFNDLEMLEFAGVPVVMGNAAPDLIAREDYHKTLSNDESGVAAAIKRFILN